MKYVITRRLRAVACEVCEIDVPADIPHDQHQQWIADNGDAETVRETQLVSLGDTLSQVVAQDQRIGATH